MLKKTKIAILTTGEELLSGTTLDTNSNYLCKEINLLSLKVDHIFVCGDDIVNLTKQIKYIAENFELLIINGGLGPTSDDLTFEALSKALNKALQLNQTAKQYLVNWLNYRGYLLNDANLKQAIMPKNSIAIQNNCGSAPGLYLKYKQCHIYCTPGVPNELYEMWKYKIKDEIKTKFVQEEIIQNQFRIFGIGESQLQQKISENKILSNSPIIIGFRVYQIYVDCKLSANIKNLVKLRECTKEFIKIFSDYIVSTKELFNLEKKCIDLLTKSKKSLSVAESITGGSLSSLITNCSGASKVFNYGLICYSNNAKTNLLNINNKIISKYGPVSSQIVKLMSKNVLNIANSDFSIATSGYASPNNDDINNQVGTVYIAWAQKNSKCICRKFNISGNRIRIQQLASISALDGLRRLILNLPIDPDYSFIKK